MIRRLIARLHGAHVNIISFILAPNMTGKRIRISENRINMTIPVAVSKILFCDLSIITVNLIS